MAGWNWEQVVPMMKRGPGSDDARGYAALQEVRAYWEGLRRGDTLPGRAQIDPRGMDRALEHVFLVERIAPGVARFRLAGMHLTVLMGMEVRGMPLTAFLEPSARDAAQTLIEAVFAGPATMELALEGERGLGRPALEGRMLLLPVIGDEGICDRALGCFVTLGTIGRSPRRFAIARQRTQAMVPRARAAAVPALPVAGSTPRPAPQPAFAEAPRAFVVPKPAAPPAVQRSRAHLRLVKFDD